MRYEIPFQETCGDQILMYEIDTLSFDYLLHIRDKIIIVFDSDT